MNNKKEEGRIVSMQTSLESAKIVGSLKDHFNNFTIERLTRAGAWGIDRDSQEGDFRNFPNKPLSLVSVRNFDPREPQSVIRRYYFLLFHEDLHKPEVVAKIEEILTAEREKEKKE